MPDILLDFPLAARREAVFRAISTPAGLEPVGGPGGPAGAPRDAE